jgi:hypothetical protein
MRILNYGLEMLLAKRHEDFIDSLFEDEIDVEKGVWSHDVVVNNAKQCAELLTLYGESQTSEFFSIILNGLQDKRYFDIMACIFFAAECRHSPPPNSIIQHAIDERLLEEFCVALLKELRALAVERGHWDWFDKTVSLPVGYYLK